MKLFQDIGVACLWIAAAIIGGLGCALASHWLTRAFWYVGATESPAAYLAYICVFCITVFVVSSALSRINPTRREE